MQLSKLIPISEAFAYLGCKRDTVYRHIREGRLQAEKIGPRTFISEHEIKRFREVEAVKIGRSDMPSEAA